MDGSRHSESDGLANDGLANDGLANDGLANDGLANEREPDAPPRPAPGSESVHSDAEDLLPKGAGRTLAGRALVRVGWWGAARDLRTPSGDVAPDGLDRLRRLAHTVEMGTSDEARRQRLAEILGRRPGDLRIISLPEDLPAGTQSDTWFVVDEAGHRIAVLKVPDTALNFGQELSGYERLNEYRGGLRLRIPEILHIGRTRRGGEEVGFLVLSVVPGHLLSTLIREVGCAAPASPQRRAALNDLDDAVRACALGMANWHTLPPGSGGRVGRGYIDRQVKLYERVEELDTLGVPADVIGHLSRRRDELTAGFRQDPGPSALLHGDNHPQNIFYDPSTQTISMIDLTYLHHSMDAAGRPIGAAAQDVVRFLMSLVAHSPLESGESAVLQETVRQSYYGAGGPGLTREAVAFFWALGAVGVVAWLAQRAEDDPRSEEVLRTYQNALKVAMRDPPELGLG